MDIEFIEQEHRDNIFKIMELCNCDMAEAYQLYNNNACNVQNAVQAKFNGISSNNNIPSNNDFNYNSPISYGNNHHFDQPYGGGSGFSQSSSYRPQIGQEDQYQSYKIFKQSGMNFNKRYQVRRDNSGLIKGVLSYLKSPENDFKKKFEDYTGRKTNLKLPIGSLSEALESVWKSKFPLIVHLSNFDAKQKQHIRTLYSDDQFIQMLNTQFQNYGINTKQYTLEPYLRQFINLQTDANSLIVFRVNIIDEIVTVSKFSLIGLSLLQVKKKIKQIKSNCINLEMEQLHLEKRYKQQLKGNFDYQKPMSLAEQRKLKQDREIRRKQQEEFYAAMQPKKQQQSSHTTTNHGTTSFTGGSQKPIVPPQPAKDLKKQAKQQRKNIRDKLKIYGGEGQDMLAIKLRLPSSQMIKLYVPSQQTAQYLYDYVFSREQDLGFEDDETKRQFDIIEPYDKINLSQKKNQRLASIFEGQTMLSLVVNEKTE